MYTLELKHRVSEKVFKRHHQTALPPVSYYGSHTTQKNVKHPQQTVLLPPICQGWQKTPHGLNHQQTKLPPIHAAQERQGLTCSKTFSVESFDSKDRQTVNNMTQGKVMSPQTVLRDYKNYLTGYELEEIKNFQQVWYLGKKGCKTRYSKLTNMTVLNSGFDSEEGYYKAIISDHLAYRFEILGVIGTGYSGQVLKCKDHKTIELVAIKVIRNKDSTHNLGRTELKILEALRELDKSNRANIVHMKEHFYFRHHLCITFKLFGKDLYRALKDTHPHGLSEKEVKQYTTDVLKCLQMLKKKRIIHGDLKPDNILMYQKDNEKHAAVSDFGGSYFMKRRDQPLIHTLYYASPEILLGKKCSPATDMWSLGCMMAELSLGHRLFRGADNAGHLNCIMKVLGVLPQELLMDAPKSNKFFNSDGVPLKMKYIAMYQSSSLAKHLNSKNFSFLDFIARCLEYDPTKRMTPREALQHPWLRKGERAKHVESDGMTKSVAPVPSSGSKELALLNRPKMPPLKLQASKQTLTKRGGNEETQ